MSYQKHLKRCLIKDELDPTLLKDTLDSIKAEMNVKVDNIVNWRRET